MYDFKFIQHGYSLFAIVIRPSYTEPSTQRLGDSGRARLIRHGNPVGVGSPLAGIR